MTVTKTINLFAIEHSIPDEVFETILEHPGFKLERIVSAGHSTPEGEWYDQDRDKWVILLTGSAAWQWRER